MSEHAWTEAKPHFRVDVAEAPSVNTADMIRIPGGTFRMGSDKHYPEEAPVHRVAVSDFQIDRTPVTNRQFREFVRATGHVTFAEIPPDPKDYPGVLPDMLFAGSLVFTPPKHPVDLRDWSQWWTFLKGANWQHPYDRDSNIKGTPSFASRKSSTCARTRTSARTLPRTPSTTSLWRMERPHSSRRNPSWLHFWPPLRNFCRVSGHRASASIKWSRRYKRAWNQRTSDAVKRQRLTRACRRPAACRRPPVRRPPP